eukprot:2571624-Pyramimonas_sp.AAC.1
MAKSAGPHIADGLAQRLCVGNRGNVHAASCHDHRAGDAYSGLECKPQQLTECVAVTRDCRSIKSIF